MLTSEEKEILDAMREHLDGEQKEAFDGLSDAEKKELAKEARKEMAKQMEGHRSGPEGFTGRMRRLRDCPWREVFLDGGEFNDQNCVTTAVVKLLLKIGSTKVGCGCLIAIAIAIVIFIILINIAQ
ncbi:MAG: hypothetical protein IJS32_03530 [Kiritimatiellae bacterium]|nr:hypothetical protein [Kiritimatiellia bacterium]